MMRLVHSLVAAGFLLLGSFGSGQAAVVDSFRIGSWNGSAFTDDQTGAFTTCVASANYRSGITLYVQVDTTYNWAIGFSAPHWNMKVGADIPLQYRIDRGAWQSGVAKATSKDLARMQMPQGGYIITRFRRGRTLYVRDGTYDYQFRLTGTSPPDGPSCQMRGTQHCPPRRRARRRHGCCHHTTRRPRPVNACQRRCPGQPCSRRSALAIEATQALFNLMSSAGLSGLKLIPDGQREEDLNGLYAVAADPARTLVAHIFPPGSYQSEEELMALIVADSQKKCAEGRFSSGSERINENGKAIYTSYANCEAGDFQLIERVAIVPRKADGVFIYGVADTYVGEGGGAPVSPPELTDPGPLFRNRHCGGIVLTGQHCKRTSPVVIPAQAGTWEPTSATCLRNDNFPGSGHLLRFMWGGNPEA